MTLDEFSAEIEGELSWREAELQLLAKSFPTDPIETRDRLRKTLVVMLYAHLEGFVKFSLLHYVSTINGKALPLADASYCIAAAAAAELFRDLRDPTRKSDYFRSTLPDDTALHRFARDRHFVEEYDKHIGLMSISIADGVVDMESNLKPEILSKNLFRLGLPYDLGKSATSNLNILLNFRNKIAHGDMRKGIDDARFKLCKSAFDDTAKYVKSVLIAAYKNQAFLRVNSYY